MKRENGYLILTDFKVLDNFKKGRKKKEWLEKDGKVYLFKTGASNYEIWAELIASEIIKQCGYDAAEYDVALYGGEVGVISPNFLKSNETIISGDVILDFYRKILLENNRSTDDLNNIESIMNAMKYYTKDRIERSALFEKLVFLWSFDNLFFESDRNPTNWSIIKDEVTEDYRFSPIYDSSTICRFNNNVTDLLNNARFNGDLNNLFKDITPQLYFSKKEKGNHFFKTFNNLTKNNPQLAKKIITALNKINIEKAITTIENRLNYNSIGKKVKFPWAAKMILEKVVIDDRLDILNSVVAKELGYEGIEK